MTWTNLKHWASSLFAERPSRRRMTREIDRVDRRIGSAPWRSALFDDADDPFAGLSAAESIALTRRMEAEDVTIAAAVNVRRNDVLARPRKVADAGAPEPIVRYVREALAGLEDFEGDLSELLDAVPHGLAVSETMLEARGERGGRPMLWPVRLLSRNPADYVFDERGELRLLTRDAPTAGEALPPAPKFLAFAWRPLHENPYGVGELRPLHRAWWMKRNAARFWAIALEKHGMPFLLARLRQRLPEAELQRVEELLGGFQTESSGWVCGEDVEELRFLEPSQKFARDVFLPFLEYWEWRILVRYLGSHLANEQTGQGSRAAAETQRGVTREIVRHDAEWLSRRISTHFIAPLVRLNFDWSGPCPRLEISTEQPDDRLTEAQTLRTLHEAGLIVPDRAWVHDRFGLPPAASPQLKVES